MEEEDNIIVKWAQEDVETLYSLLNNNNPSTLQLKPQRRVQKLCCSEKQRKIRPELQHIVFTNQCSHC